METKMNPVESDQEQQPQAETADNDTQDVATDETPEQEATDETAEEAETEEVADESEAVEVEAPAETKVETPQVQQTEEADEDEDDFQPSVDQIPENPMIDLSKLPVNDKGELDVNALSKMLNDANMKAIEVAEARATVRVENRLKERYEWDKLEAIAPGIKKDKEMRSLIQQLRAGSILENNGKSYMTPTQAYQKINKLIGQGKDAGIKESRETTRVVNAAAHLESSTTTSEPNADTSAELQRRMRSRDPKVAAAARREFLKGAIQSGDLRTKV